MTDLDSVDQSSVSGVLAPALGLVLDAVGYGSRNIQDQQDVQERLSVLMEKVLDDIDIRPEELQCEGVSGDGLSLFFPAATDPTRTLPALLAATAARLAKDNARYRDRIRIRMAAGFGLVGRGSLGVIGNLVVEINRLNDSAPIRRAILDHPESDLVVLISDILRQLLAHSGSASNALRPLDRVEVALKEYRAPAWLWIGTG